jgi:hypothetical protein
MKALQDQLDAAEGDVQALVADLSEERGGWHAEIGSWSVAECLDHLAAANRVCLDAMKEPAIRAREQGRFRRCPAPAGFVGRWFVRTLEPLQPSHWTARHQRSREATPVAGLARASVRGGLGCGTFPS